MPSLKVYSDATKHMSLGNRTRKDHVHSSELSELSDEERELSQDSELPDSEAVAEGVRGRRRREEEARGTVGSACHSSSAMNVLKRESADSRKVPSD